MALDPSIILGVNPDQGKSPNSLLDIYGQFQKLKAQKTAEDDAQQELQTKNALRAIMTKGFDQTTGKIKTDAIAASMGLDPDAAEKMIAHNESIDAAQVKQAEAQSTMAVNASRVKDYTVKAAKETADLIDDKVVGPAAIVYAKTLKTSGPVAAANAAQEILDESASALKKGGQLSVDQPVPSKFEAQAFMTSPSYMKWAKGQQDERDKQRELGDKELHDKQELGVEYSRLSQERAGKWEVLQDPKNENASYRYNPETGQATTLDGKPYTPQGAQKLGPGGTFRSLPAMVAAKWQQEHPNGTLEDAENFAADFGKKTTAAKAFGSGKQGQQVTSFNTSIAHLSTLGGLADALHNGDIPTVNRFAKAVAQETGNPAPTNFDAAKGIVGDEIVKAVVGAGGALGDRQKAQDSINRASSPQQLAGVIKTYKELMAGQLRSLKKTYESSVGLTDFDDKLLPETMRELEGGSAAPSGGWGTASVVKP